MPLLKPSAKKSKKPIRINMAEEIFDDINKYCKWANIQKLDDFFEQAVKLVFNKDREWRKHNGNK